MTVRGRSGAASVPGGLRRQLSVARVEPSRVLGQNFVADPGTLRRIVELAGVGPGDLVVEVGPGLGGLTSALAQAGAKVLALELDRRLAEASAERALPGVVVLCVDARRFDWGRLEQVAAAEGLAGVGPWSLVSNLPYRAGASIVVDVLERAPAVGRLTVMLQREVAERLLAPPGSPERGAPSVLVEHWATGRILGSVAPEVFVPRPRVRSALLGLWRRPGVGAPTYPVLSELVHRGFAQRRKTLRRALSGRVSEAELTGAGIDPRRRAEELSLAEWSRLADVVAGRSGNA